MTDNQGQTVQNETLKKIFSIMSAENVVRIGARWVSYFAAAATIYVIADGDLGAIAAASPILARFIEKIGADSLATILERVGHGDEGDQQIMEALKPIESALADLDKDTLLTEQEFYRATRILQKQDDSRLQHLSYLILSISDSLQRLRPADPAPLSLVPKTSRPYPIRGQLVGRDDDLSWLRNTPGDRLLIGQPGIGKTSLLYQLAFEENGRFVVSQDRGEIAAAISDEKPAIIIADDAQRGLDLLLDLRQLRNEIGVTFDIVASSWPSSKEFVAENLNLGQSKQHELMQLTRDEMVGVIKATGLQGPDLLIREIVDQAVGRPGLGQTLSLLCLNNGVQDLFSGSAVRQSVLKILDDLALPRETRVVLATLSFAGDVGMALEEAANLLSLGSVDLWAMLDNLGGSGIIYDAYPDRVSVHPAALRHILIRDVFFDGPMLLPVAPFLEKAPSLSVVATELIGAKFRGAGVSDNLLTSVLEKSYFPPWEKYAWLGEGEVNYVLSRHPKHLISVAKPSLHWAPEAVIPLLLAAADGDIRPIHSFPDHPLRIIDDWVHGVIPGTGEAIRRRKLLLDATGKWLASGGDSNVALSSLRTVISPNFQTVRSDPGSGNTVTIRHGYLATEELIEIQELWLISVEILKQVEIAHWDPLQRLVESWAYSREPGVTVSDELYQLKRRFAIQLLVDITELAHNHIGVLSWVCRVADSLDLELEVKIDEDYRILFPEERLDSDWRTQQEEQLAKVRELSKKWAGWSPATVASRLAKIEREASLIDQRWPRWTPELCQEIADQAATPIEWVEAMLAADVTGDLVFPFLKRSALLKEPGWVSLAKTCLAQASWRGAAIQLAITIPDLPGVLLEAAYPFLGDYHGLIETSCLRREVPEERLQILMRHENVLVARAAAHGEWVCDPKGTVRDYLLADWQQVIINDDRAEFWIREVLKSDSELAYAWVAKHIENSFAAQSVYFIEDTFQEITQVLSPEERLSLLSKVPEDVNPVLIARLIGRDLQLYKELLANEDLKMLHLVPLSGIPDDKWLDMARVAATAGYTSGEIIQSTFSIIGVSVFKGPMSNIWIEREMQFEALIDRHDEFSKTIGEIGKTYAAHEREQAEKREHNEAVYGLD